MNDLETIERNASIPTSKAAAQCRADVPLLVAELREARAILRSLMAWSRMEGAFDTERGLLAIERVIERARKASGPAR